MTRPIGYYVHHHGDGHRQRAIAIGQASGSVTLIGTGIAGRSDGLPYLELPDDRLTDAITGIDHGGRPPSLHYTPLDHEGIRQRVAALAGWMARERPRLLVVDVSVEIAMLARLASVPTVYVRLSGCRSDRPHLDAFQSAAALLAPFHEALDDDDTQSWLRAKTFYAPGLVVAPAAGEAVNEQTILVAIGRGGGISDGERWAAAARALPNCRWRVIGPCTVPVDKPANLELLGWVDQADAMIGAAGVVVGAAGDGVVGAVIAHRRPFICIPEPRPFDEQVSKAGRLSRIGSAAVARDWPAPEDWSHLVAEARARASHWPAQLADQGGPERVAEWLEQMLARKHGMMSSTI